MTDWNWIGKQIKLVSGCVMAFGLFIVPGAGLAEEYEIDTAHSSIGFKVGHFIGKVPGRFNSFSGTINYDPEDPGKSSVKATIDVGSIDTANEKRDEHLLSDDFFAKEKFPSVTFESTEVTMTGEKTADVKGKFTMHGVEKEIVLPVTMLGKMAGADGKSTVAFSAEITIDRRDYGLTWSKVVEGVSAVGDKVAIEMLIEAQSK